MASYRLLFKKSVARDLRKLPARHVAAILRRIDELAENPRARGCKKLAGGDYYRVRLGSYRIVYEVRDRGLIVQVVRVAHRSSAYD